jgi:lipoprotein NlpI
MLPDTSPSIESAYGSWTIGGPGLVRKLLATLTAVGVLLVGCASAPVRNQQSEQCEFVDAHGHPLPNATPDLAIGACTAIIQSGTSSVADLDQAFTNRGFAHFYKRQYDRAIQDFDQEIRLEPNNAGAFNNRGTVYNAMVQFDQAIQDFDQAIRLYPNDAVAFNNRGLAYEGKDQYDRAIQDLDQAIRLDPNLAVAFENRGDAYFLKGQYDQAIRDFGQVVELEPNSAKAFSRRGCVYNVLGQYDQAIQDLDQAIRLDPNYPVAFHCRGLAELYGGRASAAADDFAQMVRLLPDYAYGVIWLDIARRRAGQDDKAELAQNLRLLAPVEWPTPVAAFYLGNLSQEAVYAAANRGDDIARRGQLCQADFYLAANELSNGARASAQALFRRAADRCPPELIESWTARAELARLGR